MENQPDGRRRTRLESDWNLKGFGDQDLGFLPTDLRIGVVSGTVC